MGTPDVEGEHLGEQPALADTAVLVQDGLGHPREELAQAGLFVAQDLDPPGDPGADPGGELEKDVVFRREVEVERAPRHARRAGDPVDLGRGDADGAELLEGHGEDPFAGIDTLAGTRPAGGRRPDRSVAALGGNRRREAPLEPHEYVNR